MDKDIRWLNTLWRFGRFHHWEGTNTSSITHEKRMNIKKDGIGLISWWWIILVGSENSGESWIVRILRDSLTIHSTPKIATPMTPKWQHLVHNMPKFRIVFYVTSRNLSLTTWSFSARYQSSAIVPPPFRRQALIDCIRGCPSHNYTSCNYQVNDWGW